MRSRVMPESLAIAWPIFWTSFGARYLNTCAASSSPIDISRMALFIRPASLIAVHPALDYVGDDLGIVARHLPRALQLVEARGRDLRRRFSCGQRHHRLGGCARGRNAQHRTYDAEPQVAEQRGEERVLAD